MLHETLKCINVCILLILKFVWVLNPVSSYSRLFWSWSLLWFLIVSDVYLLVFFLMFASNHCLSNPACLCPSVIESFNEFWWHVYLFHTPLSMYMSRISKTLLTWTINISEFYLQNFNEKKVIKGKIISSIKMFKKEENGTKFFLNVLNLNQNKFSIYFDWPICCC